MGDHTAEDLARAPSAKLEGLLVVGTYATLAAVWTSVHGFVIPYHYWQILPESALRQNAALALLNLHAQPPILNALLALILKASDASRLPPETIAATVQFAVGILAVAALWFLSARLVQNRLLRWAALALVVLNPFTYATTASFFYPLYELGLLVALAAAALRFFEEPSPGRFAFLVAPAVLLVNFRTLFHPAWFAAVLLLVTGLAWRQMRARWRSHAVIAGVGLILVVAWPVKNLVRFGFFGFSSWEGFSLSRGLPIENRFFREVFVRTAHRRLNPELAAVANSLVPLRLRGDPGIAEAQKVDGSPNWNHFVVIDACRALREAAVREYRAEPGLILKRAAYHYLIGLTTYAGRSPYTDGITWDVTDVRERDGGAWPELYELLVVQRFRKRAPGVLEGQLPPATTGLAFTLPLVVIAPGLVMWRQRRSLGAGGKTLALMSFCVAWALLLILLVDGIEGNRMRFCVEPFLLLGVAWAVDPIAASRHPKESEPA